MMAGRTHLLKSAYFNDIQNLFVKAVSSVERSVGSVHFICKSLPQGFSHGQTEFIIVEMYRKTLFTKWLIYSPQHFQEPLFIFQTK